MLKMDGNNIEISRGDSMALRVSLAGRDLPEGSDAVFTVRKKLRSEKHVLQKRFNASDESVTILLSSEETNLQPGLYYWDLRLQIPAQEGGYEVVTPMDYAAFVVLDVVGHDIGVEGEPGINPDLPIL